MALADLDVAAPGYRYDGTYLPSGQLAQRYIGGGVLPQGYNTGAFLPNGQLHWASNATAGGPAVRTAAPAIPYTSDRNGNYPWNAGAPVQPRFNLASLFSGGPMAVNTSNQSRGTPGMFATTKSQPVQGGINTAMTTRTTNAGAEQQSLKDYAAAVLSGQPKAQQFADEETAAVGRIYGTGGDSVEARLAQLNRQEQAAQNIAAQRAASGVRRGINAQRAGGGSSSYLDRLLAQQLYGIGAAGAGRGAQQGRSDLTWLTGQRTGQVGRRQNILDILAQRGLAPVMAGQQIEQGALGNMGRLADLDYGNNIYERPEDAWRRQQEFVDYASPYFQY